jgi:hypothetical protein
MLLFKLFGFLDVLTIISMILLTLEIIPWRFGLIFASYLIIKGLIFKGDFNSFVDIIIGVYIIFIPVFSWKLLTTVFAIYLGQKAFFSFF